MQNIISLDEKVFHWFNSLVGISSFSDLVIKVLAVYAIYFVPLFFLFFWFIYYRTEKIQKFLLGLFVTSVISWQVIARIIGMLVNRARPEGFAGTKELMFHPPTYSFPSDHALFLAFLTAYLYLAGYKKMGNFALIVTIIISLSRVTAGFHWPGDVLAGWIIGAVLAYFFYSIRGFVGKYIVNPLYFIAKKIRLT